MPDFKYLDVNAMCVKFDTGRTCIYRWEKSGQSLQRVLNDVDCLQEHLSNYADKRIYRELLLQVVPQFVDSLPALCPGGSERRVQGVHVVAEA